jgi:CBS domain-containing protein
MDIHNTEASPAHSLAIHELSYLLDKIRVDEIMTRHVITISPDIPVEEAATVLHDNKIGSLPVVENGMLVGMLTEEDLLKLMRDHQLRVPIELRVLLTTLGVLEGVAKQIDPGFQLIDATKPFARRLMPDRYSPGHILKASLRSLRAYSRFFDQLPVHATRALRRIGDGEFRVAVRPDNYEGLVDRLTAGVYLLAYALIVGALIVGFALLLGRQDLRPLEHIGYRIALFAAIASVIWLVIRSLRFEWHKRKADKRARR